VNEARTASIQRRAILQDRSQHRISRYLRPMTDFDYFITFLHMGEAAIAF
jgi:hypothetical protein